MEHKDRITAADRELKIDELIREIEALRKQRDQLERDVQFGHKALQDAFKSACAERDHYAKMYDEMNYTLNLVYDQRDNALDDADGLRDQLKEQSKRYHAALDAIEILGQKLAETESLETEVAELKHLLERERARCDKRKRQLDEARMRFDEIKRGRDVWRERALREKARRLTLEHRVEHIRREGATVEMFVNDLLDALGL